MKKIRLDLLLVERGLIETRSAAQRFVMAGQVRVNGVMVDKPAVQVDSEAELVVQHGAMYVSRGGEKLAAALQEFPVEVHRKMCADVGASTGGFTDCLLQNGARKVYAIDVGKGILAWKLRQDPRVVVMEEVNVRFLPSLPEPIELVTIDVAFISLKLVLPVVRGWFRTLSLSDQILGDVIALVKPQFEAGRKEVARGDGVIRDPEIHQRIINDILSFVQQEGFEVRGLYPSPLLGPKGNREFFIWLGVLDKKMDSEKPDSPI